MRGIAVFHGEGGVISGTIENLSRTGALIQLTGIPTDRAFDPEMERAGLVPTLELKLGSESGLVGARPVRVETVARGPGSPRDFRIAVQFDRVDDDVQFAIDAAVLSAVRAAHQRPILV